MCTGINIIEIDIDMNDLNILNFGLANRNIYSFWSFLLT